MPRQIKWIFFKVILQRNVSVQARQDTLVQRFLGADTYLRRWRGVDYRYQLYDVTESSTEVDGRTIVFGRLTRSPKTAYGRTLDSETRISEPRELNIMEIADSTEFIYDLRSCVLALHRHSPFTNGRAISRVWSNLLGQPYHRDTPRELDVSAECLRDTIYATSLLSSDEPLREVKITFARPNPGSGDDILARIHLGLIGEDTESDEITFDAKKKTGGSLKKTGFLPTSIETLLGQGYVKNGFVRVGEQRHDLLDAHEKERTTEGYILDGNGQSLLLPQYVDLWFTELAGGENDDIYPEV